MPDVQPIPMVLTCPSCGVRHIDEGEFATRPHHTHACQSCGVVWRPAIVPTVGVRFLPGFKNEEPSKDEGWKERWNAGETRNTRVRWNPRGDAAAYLSYFFSEPHPSKQMRKGPLVLPQYWGTAEWLRIQAAMNAKGSGYVVEFMPSMPELDDNQLLRTMSFLDEIGLLYRYAGKRLHLV